MNEVTTILRENEKMMRTRNINGKNNVLAMEESERERN